MDNGIKNLSFIIHFSIAIIMAPDKFTGNRHPEEVLVANDRSKTRSFFNFRVEGVESKTIMPRM